MEVTLFSVLSEQTNISEMENVGVSRSLKSEKTKEKKALKTKNTEEKKPLAAEKAEENSAANAEKKNASKSFHLQKTEKSRFFFPFDKDFDPEKKIKTIAVVLSVLNSVFLILAVIASLALLALEFVRANDGWFFFAANLTLGGGIILWCILRGLSHLIWGLGELVGDARTRGGASGTRIPLDIDEVWATPLKGTETTETGERIPVRTEETLLKMSRREAGDEIPFDESVVWAAPATADADAAEKEAAPETKDPEKTDAKASKKKSFWNRLRRS